MKTLEPMVGSDLYTVLQNAVKLAPCQFAFNYWRFATRKGETFDEAKARFEAENKF